METRRIDMFGNVVYVRTDHGYTDAFLYKVLARIDIHTDDKERCWEWKRGCSAAGYGKIRLNGDLLYAHRITYIIFKGQIPEGEYVCHTCDNPTCCNPNHLFVGTAQDNAKDASSKGRLQVGKSLTAFQVKQIKDSEGSYEQIARDFGVSSKTVSLIKRGETWKFIDDMTDKEIMESTIQQTVNKEINKKVLAIEKVTCIICGKEVNKRDSRAGRCKACDSYYRRNGKERPYGSGDGRSNQGTTHPSSKLTVEQIKEIKYAPESITNAQLAKKFDVAWPTINKIRKGLRYKDL